MVGVFTGCVLFVLFGSVSADPALEPSPFSAPEPDPEERYYRMLTVEVPEPIKLEVGGIATLPGDEIAVVNRRGELWRITGVSDPEGARFRLFASGLHEPLGMVWRDGAFYVVQRTELTRISDTDGDGVADEYRTVAKGWGVTGNYHEYAYGPKFDTAGNAWIALNSTIGNKVVEDSAWRGWSLKVAPDGSWSPVSGGMRSPAGLGINEIGDAFYTDQQGNWIATCFLAHMKPGVFHGHADALRYCSLPGATFEHPGPLPKGLKVHEAARAIPAYELPAVWLPYRKMGTSSTDVVLDTTRGRFGPFTNQFFVGEFTLSAVNRVFLEKIDGEYQGACFPFRKGFQCGVIRMAFDEDGSMWAGQSNRGWNSVGTRSYGLQRLVWTGETPFEIREMNALPDGFRLRFTRPVDRRIAQAPENYKLKSYTYLYHSTYGSPEVDPQDLAIEALEISESGTDVYLQVRGLREGYVHELNLSGFSAADGAPLLHPQAYYTLNRIPKGN